VNYPGRESGISVFVRWRRPVQLADALRLVWSEYQVFRHRTQILQRRREKKFMVFWGPESALA